MLTAITGGNVITPYRVLPGAAVLLKDGKIAAVYEDGRIPETDEIIDASGKYVSPGFIEMHCHGGGGYDFMDGTVEAIEGAAKAHMRHGTTSISPTTLTCTDEDLFGFFACFREAKKAMRGGPNLLGAHLEGPYFADSQRGAQDPKFLKKPLPDHYQPILEHRDIIARISLAPELPGALGLADALRQAGILAAVGHSDAEYEQMLTAYEHGFSHVTHLYSGMSMLHRRNAYRHLGVVESAYLIDGMTVEIIADGCHLPPELLKLILRSKPMSQICLITDSMRGAGMAEGSTVLLGGLKNGQPCVIRNGVAFMPDGSCFAGSVCTADRCVRTMVKQVGVAVEDAVRMMTANPARVMGLDRSKGVVAPGMDADLCIFDEDVNIARVIVGGETTYMA